MNYYYTLVKVPGVPAFRPGLFYFLFYRFLSRTRQPWKQPAYLHVQMLYMRTCTCVPVRPRPRPRLRYPPESSHAATTLVTYYLLYLPETRDYNSGGGGGGIREVNETQKGGKGVGSLGEGVGWIPTKLDTTRHDTTTCVGTHLDSS